MQAAMHGNCFGHGFSQSENVSHPSLPHPHHLQQWHLTLYFCIDHAYASKLARVIAGQADACRHMDCCHK